MGKTLKKYNWDAPSVLTRTEKATYPWDEWLNGDIWKLTQGEDFHPHPLMMERIVRTRATGRGAKIRMRHEPLNGDAKNPFGVIIVQRTDIDGPSENGKAPAKPAAKAPAKKAPVAKKAPARKAPAKPKAITPEQAAKKANGNGKLAPRTRKERAAATKKAAPTKAAVKKVPAKRPARQVVVDGPAPAAPSKKAAPKVLVSA